MANCTPDEKNQRLSCENHACSSSTLAVSLFTCVVFGVFFSETSMCMLTVGTGVLFYFSKSVFFNF